MRLTLPKTFIGAVLLLLGVITANAQQLQASLSHYSTENGLASNAISDIVQDDYGYIWLATWNGVSRFDGYNFFNYRTGAGSHVPLLHNRVMDLAVDNQQNIWLRMYDGRVFVIKRSIDTIINPFEGISGYEEFITNNPVFVTNAGDVLVNVEGVGIYKLRIEQQGVSSQLITTGGLTVTSMAEGYQSDIWLGTDKGVHRMDVSNLTVERRGLFLEEHIICLHSNGYNIFAGTQSGKIYSFSYGQEPKLLREGNQPILKLFVDSHGLIWFSDGREGVIRLKPGTNDEKTFTQHVSVPDYDGKGSVFHEAKGTLWARMTNGGYGYYNRERDEVEYFHNDPWNPWNLSNTVNASLEMGEGVIWESTSRRGLEKLEIQKNTIERIQLHPEEGPSLANEVRALLFDSRRQQLIIANKMGEVFFYLPNGSCKIISKDSKGNPLGRIYGIMVDTDGSYWLSSKGYGLYKFTHKADGYDIQHFSHVEGNDWSLNDDRVYNTVQDKAGNIWMSTYGGGVNLLTKDKKGNTVVLHRNNVMKKYPYNSHRKVRVVALDKDDNVWAGSTDGILIMSYKDNKVEIEPLKNSEEDPQHILMSNDIVCMAKDWKGDMWIGTNGGGLAHTIGKDSKGCWLFETFGAKDGLPSEEIRGITFDNRGNVWFSTDNVLCSFDMGKRIFTTFSQLDGVDEALCSEGAAICMPNGNILFGTINGYYLVDRTKLVTTTGRILKLRITDFWINDELQSPRLNNAYDYYVPDSKQVELPNHSAFITFRFTSLNYQLQHRVHYQYMLEGYDRTWINADASRTASYANLPTGKYRFQVKAFLLESPEMYDMREIDVIVPPYFFLSTNAIWVYMALFVAGAIWLLFWIQARMDREEKMRVLREGPRQQKEQPDAGNEFMSFLNDFMELHYSDPVLKVEELQTVMDMTLPVLTQHLMTYTGLSPKEYIVEFRLKKAIAFLEQSDDSIAQIAYNCGYMDSAKFNRQFKNKTGVMPSKYRDSFKQHSQQTEEATDDYELVDE